MHLKIVDYTPFAEAARLLYEGPWVSERYLACQPLIDENPQAIHPVVREIIAGGKSLLAKDLFAAQYRLADLKQICDGVLAEVDALMLPTAGRMFTVKELLDEPIRHNSELGYYTNFVNLLDYSALAIPAGNAADGRPFGVTLIGPAFYDRDLLSIANALQENAAAAVTDSRRVEVVVCGAHLRGMGLNWQLLACGATFKAACNTTAHYRLYALDETPLRRPAMVRDEENGQAIAVEIWSMPVENFGAFTAMIPAPLGIGKVLTDDGKTRSGFICEANALRPQDRDISEFGGWKAFLRHRDGA